MDVEARDWKTVCSDFRSSSFGGQCNSPVTRFDASHVCLPRLGASMRVEYTKLLSVLRQVNKLLQFKLVSVLEPCTHGKQRRAEVKRLADDRDDGVDIGRDHRAGDDGDVDDDDRGSRGWLKLKQAKTQY
jgi:hypothetical protein